ncbi:hypothetical protein RI065_07825 [Mycoplasmatota bacterium zrk1]
MKKNKKNSKIKQVQEIQGIIKESYVEVRRWIKSSYFIVLFITVVIIAFNIDTMKDLILRNNDSLDSGILPLFLTVSTFILIVVPLMSIFTRRKCPHCYEIVMKNSTICHKCGCDLKNNK